ncbi:unnamed protein product [Tuwongella immobilis]|uniref:Uncharacterized protein n=1 Tax=Tuwongella immobilis TaxID=692036 RepID=A0A6C2YQR9_9BACT|nr:unnamed protein product [Tuwongella immobilis]VTS03783.1 unnamed protein product [Tuwongella immobilis]
MPIFADFPGIRHGKSLGFAVVVLRWGENRSGNAAIAPAAMRAEMRSGRSDNAQTPQVAGRSSGLHSKYHCMVRRNPSSNRIFGS